MLFLSKLVKRITMGRSLAIAVAIAACTGGDGTSSPPATPVDPGTPVHAAASISDLRVVDATDSSATISFTEVTDGSGAPATYELRYGPAPLSWNSASSVTVGPCAAPVAGSGAGVTRTCAVYGLTDSTAYALQLGVYPANTGNFTAPIAFSNIASFSTRFRVVPVASLTLSPPTASIAVGTTQQYGVTLRDSHGNVLTGRSLYWATSNTSIATVSQGGLVTAVGAGTVTVGALSEGIGGTASLTVTVAAQQPTLTQVVLTPASVTLQPGANQPFSVSGVWSNGATTAPQVTFSATGGTITMNGIYSAGSTAGTYRVIAVQQGGVLADTSVVTIAAAPPTLTQVVMTPASASVVSGGTQPFSVSGVWSNGATTAPSVTYSATGGTISSAGLYTAGTTAGTFRVIAVQQGGTLADTSAVTVTAAPPTLTQVVLTPVTVSLSTGGTQQFAVSGVWSNGATTAPAVTYSATGGTISAAGLYTAGTTAGTFRVIAVQQGGTLADTSAVTVTAVAPTLTQVVLTPASVSLLVGGTQQFAVSGVWSNGATTAPAVNYSATGGTISAAGLYAAGSTAGTFRVIAVQQGGTHADTSSVTITAASSATTLLSEGFESGSLASHGWFDASTVTVANDARPGSTGTHALQWHWTAGLVQPQGTSRFDFTPSSSVYLSYWVKTSSNWVGSNEGYHPHMFNILTTADDHWIGPSISHLTLYDELLWQNGNLVANEMIQDAAMINTASLLTDLLGITENRAIGGYNGRHEFSDATSSVGWQAYQASPGVYTNYKSFTPKVASIPGATKTSWHHVESYWQMNTVVGGIGQQNGVMQYWVDGVLQIDRHDVFYRTGANPTMQFRTFLMGPYIGDGSPVDQYMWIDDLLVATAHP